jgi:hypothetical protein
MRKSTERREREQAVREARFDRHRQQEAAKLRGELEKLDARREEIGQRLNRLEQPSSIDAIRDLVNAGEALTADETARLAAEDADLFNELMEAKSPLLRTG